MSRFENIDHFPLWCAIYDTMDPLPASPTPEELTVRRLRASEVYTCVSQELSRWSINAASFSATALRNVVLRLRQPNDDEALINEMIQNWQIFPNTSHDDSTPEEYI